VKKLPPTAALDIFTTSDCCAFVTTHDAPAIEIGGFLRGGPSYAPSALRTNADAESKIDRVLAYRMLPLWHLAQGAAPGR
jgi:hypothetical protein